MNLTEALHSERITARMPLSQESVKLKLPSYGNNYRTLNKHLFENSDGVLELIVADPSIVTDSLLDELTLFIHIYEGHIARLLNKNIIKSYSSPVETNCFFHVNADITKFSLKALTDETAVLSNLRGSSVIHYRDWGAGFPEADLSWNLSHCDAIGTIVGYPGYEWPRNRESYLHSVAEHAISSMIGTHEQLERYRDYGRLADSVLANTEVKRPSETSIHEKQLGNIVTNLSLLTNPDFKTRKIAEKTLLHNARRFTHWRTY